MITWYKAVADHSDNGRALMSKLEGEKARNQRWVGRQHVPISSKFAILSLSLSDTFIHGDGTKNMLKEQRTTTVR